MRKTPLLFALPIMAALLTTPLQASAATPPDREPEQHRTTEHPLPETGFWERLAQCETAGNWKNGGRWAGGLGIYTNGSFRDADAGTWERFGGEEFAPSPDRATKEQQIVVANRIAVLGYSTVVHRDPKTAKRMGVPATYVWDKKPSGFGGWGCYRSKHTGRQRMAKPKMYYSADPSSVPLLTFSMGQRGKEVHDLQTFVGGLKVDGVYGIRTRKAHIAYLKKHGLSTAGVPGTIRRAGVSAMSLSSHRTVKSCPKWEPLLRKYGLPVKQFTYIMWRESRCEPRAIGWNYRAGTSHRDCKRSPAETYKRCRAVKSYDSGLLQINSSWTTVTARVCGTKWGDMSALLDPKCNLKVAKYLYEDGGGMSNWAATSGNA